MSSFNSFNDPFDGALHMYSHLYDDGMSELDIAVAVKTIYSNKNSGFNDHPSMTWIYDDRIIKQALKWADMVINNIDMEHVIDFHRGEILKTARTRLKNFSATCFNRTGPEDLLMWAHYADNHSGFCVEYSYDPMELSFKEEGRFKIAPVIYRSSLPSFDIKSLLFTPANVAVDFLFSKSEQWAYEREVRLVKFLENDSNLTMLPDGLKIEAIYAGLNISEPMLERLDESANLLGVKFYRMKRKPFGYSLEAEFSWI